MFKQKFIKFLMSRGGLTLFNYVLLAIFTFSLVNAFSLLFNKIDDTLKMDSIMNAIATILVAYGVVLEEREGIFKIAEIYPSQESKAETAMDHLCHDYGITFLVIGLFIEVTTEIVKIPCQVINFAAVETPIFAGGMILSITGVLTLIYFSMKIIHSGQVKTEKAA